MAELLLEILSEEIPARMQTQAARDLERMARERLAEAGFLPEGVKAFAGPRRLTLAVDGLDDLAATLEGAGLTPRWEDDQPGIRHFYVDDPFGNRIELLPRQRRCEVRHQRSRLQPACNGNRSIRLDRNAALELKSCRVRRLRWRLQREPVGARLPRSGFRKPDARSLKPAVGWMPAGPWRQGSRRQRLAGGGVRANFRYKLRHRARFH